MINGISNYIIPMLIFVVVGYGFFKKINIYESFLSGIKASIGTMASIIPSIFAMIFAVNIFLKSNVLAFLLQGVNPLFSWLNVPINIIPMALLRPISGNASLAILTDLFATYGPDSLIGRLGSTIQGCTDTTLYVLALYFGSIKITKTRHALAVGLFADVVAIVASIVIVNIVFSG